MADIAKRFAGNPILRPRDIKPSHDGLDVVSLLNPGAFRFQDKTWLLLRVAERPLQKDRIISTPIFDPIAANGMSIIEVSLDDPALLIEESRSFMYKGQLYLTTLSHLRLASSEDGVTFHVEEMPTLLGQGKLEVYGIEDCRVSEIAGVFYLTYAAVSPYGIGIGMISTSDWRQFTHHGMILPPTNKDAALFPAKIGGSYYILHRPSSVGLGGSFIWLSRSPDLIHWGEHDCIAMSRPNTWDSARIGAGAAPIRIPEGWLEIYHGADEENRYCLGALLLDGDDPRKVLARSAQPIMEPLTDYEKMGFFGNVVFTNGMIVAADTITMYYGAADEVICGATLSIQEILKSLGK